MPFLGQDDKQLQDQNSQGNQSNGGAPVGNSGGGFAGGGGGGSEQPTISGSPVQGMGGSSGGWTNIQSYLNANQSNASNILGQNVGGQLDKEKSDAESKANEAKTQSKQQVESSKVGQDEASKLITEASQNNQESANKLKGSVNAQYQGPQGFEYNINDKTNQYGTAVKSEEGTRNLLNDMYKQMAGGRMGQGAMNLQNQIDLTDQNLGNKRQELAGKYSGLVNDVGQMAGSTDAEVKANKQAFDQQNNDLRNFLMQQKDQNRNEIQSGADRWNREMGEMAADPNRLNDGRRARIAQGANFYNMGGYDDQRAKYNAIAQALGLSENANRSGAGPALSYYDVAQSGGGGGGGGGPETFTNQSGTHTVENNSNPFARR